MYLLKIELMGEQQYCPVHRLHVGKGYHVISNVDYVLKSLLIMNYNQVEIQMHKRFTKSNKNLFNCDCKKGSFS